jgi:hypothetical protein
MISGEEIKVLAKPLLLGILEERVELLQSHCSRNCKNDKNNAESTKTCEEIDTESTKTCEGIDTESTKTCDESRRKMANPICLCEFQRTHTGRGKG